MNKLLTIILSVLVLTLTCAVLPRNSYATTGDLSVDFGTAGSLFNVANMTPGQTVSKSFKITNTATNNRVAAIRAGNPSQTGTVASAMHITVSQGTTDLYGGSKGAKTLQQFFIDSASGAFISLPTVFHPLDSATYTLTVMFDQSAGNQFQGKNVTFDILIGSDLAGNQGSTQPIFTLPQLQDHNTFTTFFNLLKTNIFSKFPALHL